MLRWNADYRFSSIFLCIHFHNDEISLWWFESRKKKKYVTYSFKSCTLSLRMLLGFSHNVYSHLRIVDRETERKSEKASTFYKKKKKTTTTCFIDIYFDCCHDIVHRKSKISQGKCQCAQRINPTSNTHTTETIRITYEKTLCWCCWCFCRWINRWCRSLFVCIARKHPKLTYVSIDHFHFD